MTTSTYKEEIEYCRAMGEKTWIKKRHLKKYLNARYDAEHYKGY